MVRISNPAAAPPGARGGGARRMTRGWGVGPSAFLGVTK
jgi:hypothetical protein